MSGNSSAEIIDEITRWIVGGGIITIALFPLALPLLALTMIAAIPLVLIALAGALAVAVVAVPFLLARGLGRRVIGALRPARTAERGGPTLASRAPAAPLTIRPGISSHR